VQQHAKHANQCTDSWPAARLQYVAQHWQRCPPPGSQGLPLSVLPFVGRCRGTASYVSLRRYHVRPGWGQEVGTGAGAGIMRTPSLRASQPSAATSALPASRWALAPGADGSVILPACTTACVPARPFTSCATCWGCISRGMLVGCTTCPSGRKPAWSITVTASVILPAQVGGVGRGWELAEGKLHHGAKLRAGPQV
jgi:hypothetical protein